MTASKIQPSINLEGTISRMDELLEVSYRSAGLGSIEDQLGIQRILTRLGLVGPRSPKFDHERLKLAVASDVWKRLHTNLQLHGRGVCRKKNPRCENCVLISFCDHARKTNLKRKPAPVAIDLFAGAGGLSYGFSLAGFRIALAVESDRNAAQTYRANHPGTPVIEASVAALSAQVVRKVVPDISEPDAVIAGAPCQGYSLAGSRKARDPRNFLYQHVSRLAAELRAHLVVVENVPGIQRVNGAGFLPAMVASLRRRGYSAKPHLLRSSDFGVSQNRKRFFILGRRSDLGTAPGPPSATHRPFGTSEDCEELPETAALASVLKDLPEFPPGTEAERLVLPDGSLLLNASTMAHSAAVVAKIQKVPPGGGPISYRRLERHEARTLIAGHRALPVHPWLDRTISVREASRIQGFPDSYFFCGPRSEQPLQVANAVPPPLAEAIAKKLKKLTLSRGAALD